MTAVTFDIEHDLQLDAYLPDMSDKVNDRALSVPVVIHYHRGGMLIGSKGGIYPSFMPGKYTYLSHSVLLENLIKILSLPSISENSTHLPQLQITFPVLCGRYNTGRAVAFHIYRFCRNRAIIHPAFQRPLSLDTSRIVVVGVSGGDYPARAAATLSSIVPRPIGWLDLFGVGGDWLLDFWINGVDVERTMPLDITLHDMAKADELMKTGGGAVVSEVESVLVDGKLTGELGRFNLWIAWQKRASSLAMSYLSLESQPDSLKYRISLG